MENLITIALPVYKRTDFVRSALDSAVNQTKACNILLIDNNSPHDDFRKIVESYGESRIKYVKTKETVPQDENFNNCFRYADTPWVTVLHDDDMLHCQYVEFSLGIIEKYKDSVGGIAYPSHVGVEEWDGIKRKVEFPREIKIMNPAFFYFNNLPFPGVLVQKDIAQQLNGFNSELHPIADFDFWYRYSKHTQMIFADIEMSYYRISPSQSTNHLIDAMINNIYQYRLKEIESGRHNNFLCKLGLEQGRINNINYFKTTYDSVDIPPLINEKSYLRAKRILNNRITNKIISRYRRAVSFSSLIGV